VAGETLAGPIPAAGVEQPIEREPLLARRSPGLWTVASLLTLGLAGAVWHYKINNDAKKLALEEPELSRLAKGWSPGLSVFALLAGTFTLGISALVTTWRTWTRVRLATDSDRLGAGYQFCMTFIPIVNIFHHAVLQSELNVHSNDETDNRSAVVLLAFGLLAIAAVAIAIAIAVSRNSTSASSNVSDQTQRRANNQSGQSRSSSPGSTAKSNPADVLGSYHICRNSQPTDAAAASVSIYGNFSTSCGFATNVFNRWWTSPEAASHNGLAALHVFSPATQRRYWVNCYGIPGYIECVNGGYHIDLLFKDPNE